MREQDASPYPPRTKFAAVWLGESARPEFAPAFALPAERMELSTGPSWHAADLPATANEPALVVVAQGSPGEFTEADVVRLRRRYPIAAILRIVGSWCEGELRTSPPPAAVRRLWWHQASAFLRADLERLAAGIRPDWGLPATATDDEALLTSPPADFALRAGVALQTGVVHIGIAASDPFVERWLLDFCSQHEHLAPHVVDAAAPLATDLILWDAPLSVAAGEQQLHRLVHDHPQSKVIALATFPRRDELALWSRAGVVDVIGKPISDAGLLACLVAHAD